MTLTDSRGSNRSLFKFGLLGVTLMTAEIALCGPGAHATPMRCSGEQNTCIASCKKNPAIASIPTCITNCGSRQAYCMKTGCWDTGFQKYCGLLKQ